MSVSPPDRPILDSLFGRGAPGVQVLEVVAGYRPDVPDAAALAAAVHANALRLFWPEDLDPPPEGAGPVPPP